MSFNENILARKQHTTSFETLNAIFPASHADFNLVWYLITFYNGHKVLCL